MTICTPTIDSSLGRLGVYVTGNYPTGDDLYAGKTIYDPILFSTLQYNGTTWVIISEPPQTWNVTSVTQSGAKSCTTTYGWYQRSNGMFVAQITLTGFAAGVAGNDIQVPTPLTLADANALGGSFNYFDSGATRYAGAVYGASTTAAAFFTDGAASAFGTTPSLALAAADVLQITIHGRYA